MIQDPKASSRYATAFFLLLKGKGAAKKAYEELLFVHEFVKRHPELGRLLITSTISSEEKNGLIDNLLAEAGQDTQNFVKLLVKKRRFPLFEGILARVKELYYEAEGIEEVTVVSALPLDAALEKQLQSVLEKRLKKQVLLHAKVDASLIGGLSVYTKNLVLEGSVKSQLREIKKMLLSQRG